MNGQRTFRLRAFISILSGFSFIIMAATGIVLFITPPGRVANWTGWTFWHLTKHEWIDLHLCFGLIFVLTCLIHIWLNIKPLMQYFVKTADAAKRMRWEPAAALILCGLVFWAALKPFVPFSSLLNLNDRIKFSWEKPAQRAPIPHAELLSIEELARKAEIETDTLIENLNAVGIQAEGSDVFGTLAEQNGLSPDALFQIAAGASPSTRGGGHQGGFGQKTLRQVCEDMNVDVQDAIETLKTAGIEATPEMRVRAIADEHEIHPSQIRKRLENQ